MQKTIITRITKVARTNTKKDGTPFLDKNGKPFWKVSILTEATGTKWYSCLAFREDAAEMKIVEGSNCTLIVWEDGQWANFKIPSKSDLLEERVKKLEEKVFQGPVGDSGVEYPDEEVTPAF